MLYDIVQGGLMCCFRRFQGELGRLSCTRAKHAGSPRNGTILVESAAYVLYISEIIRVATVHNGQVCNGFVVFHNLRSFVCSTCQVIEYV